MQLFRVGTPATAAIDVMFRDVKHGFYFDHILLNVHDLMAAASASGEIFLDKGTLSRLLDRADPHHHWRSSPCVDKRLAFANSEALPGEIGN